MVLFRAGDMLMWSVEEQSDMRVSRECREQRLCLTRIK
jgi:hypothetical protein